MNSELPTPKSTNTVLYQCAIHLVNHIVCEKLDKDTYLPMEHSKLIPIHTIFPTFLHKYFIKSAFLKKDVIILNESAM